MNVFAITVFLPLIALAQGQREERNCSISEPWRCDKIDTFGLAKERFFFRVVTILGFNHDAYMCKSGAVFCRSFADVKDQPKAGCYEDTQIGRPTGCECRVFTNSNKTSQLWGVRLQNFDLDEMLLEEVHPNLIKLLNWHLNSYPPIHSLCKRFAMFLREDELSFEERIARIDAEHQKNSTTTIDHVS